MAAARLTRSETDRKIGGVAGGVAAYFGIDPTLVRIGFVVAALMGWGVLAYVILWIALLVSIPAAGWRGTCANSRAGRRACSSGVDRR